MGCLGGQLQCFQSFQLLPNPIHFHAAAQQSQPIPIYHLARSVMPNQATSDAKKNNVTHSCCPGALLQYIMGTTTHTKFEPWMSWVLKPLAVGVVMVLLYADLSCLPAMCCPMLYLYHSASGISHFMDHFFVSIGGTTRKTRVLSTAFLPYKCDISSAIWQPAWKCSS